ncbi:hypothetical protein [Novosphingobium rosa]|uniref:hypothetical protein n=1 Tax=Novosphingobium rosa TaxID=76978 RepID=UPI000834C2E6|nr:hypothetical protein [Novosphingobium rosa]
MIEDDDLAVLKARRDISRANLIERVGEVRHLAANPATLISRARADLEHGTRSATFQALDIANDNRGIVVATASALMLWLMRQQVARQIALQLGHKLGDSAIEASKALVEKAPGWAETWGGKAVDKAAGMWSRFRKKH